MRSIDNNQKLKQAGNLKNSWKLKETLNTLNDFGEEKVLTNCERV